MSISTPASRPLATVGKYRQPADNQTKPIRIAFLIDTIACDTAGTQKQLLEILKRLDRGVFEPHLVCLSSSPWMESATLPCPTVVLGYRGLLKPSLPAVLRKLARFLDERGIDIVQTFFEDSIFVAWLGAARSASRPVLVSSRRDIGLGTGNQPWYHALYRHALPWVNRRFTGIVANCEAVRQYVAEREKTPLTKITVIYNGVTPCEVGAHAVPELFRQYPADVWLALSASLTPVKRHDLAINALAQLTAENTAMTARLLCLGEGGEQARLERLAETLGVRGRVHFAGAVRNVESYLLHAHIGVLCSDREGLSNAILEYMACGLPVVATAVGGNAELVDRDNGICVPPNDARALAEALRKLVSDRELRIRQGAASHARARERFSWERSMAQLQAYYHALPRSTAR